MTKNDAFPFTAAMRKRAISFLCVFLTAAFVLSGHAFGSAPTAAAKVKKSKKCLFPKSRKRAPVWLCDAKADGLAVTAVGSAAKSGAGISFMEQMAAADARARLAQALSVSFQKRIAGQEKIAESADSVSMNGADRDHTLITRITHESLQGTKVLKKVYGPNGTLYVLVGLDEASAKKLGESIATDYLQRKSTQE